MEKIFETQVYCVKFDMGNPVDVNICVERNNETELTRKEIIDEALGYAQEVGITVTEEDLFEIETIEIVEQKYKVQAYSVRYDFGQGVEASFNIERYNLPKLTKDEIIMSAISKAQSSDIQLHKATLVEITTLTLEQ